MKWLCVAGMLLAGVASAETPAFDIQMITGSLVKKGSDRTMAVGAVATGAMDVAPHLRAFVRAGGWALPDGGSVDASDPRAFTTGELYGGLIAKFNPTFGVIGTGGLGVNLDRGIIVGNSMPKTASGGLIFYFAEKRYITVQVGIHEAAGPGMKILASGNIPIKGPSSIVFDAALGGSSFFRWGVALSKDK